MLWGVLFFIAVLSRNSPTTEYPMQTLAPVRSLNIGAMVPSVKEEIKIWGTKEFILPQLT